MHKPVKESALAHKYLDGLKGIEIGGASYNAFGLDTINVDIKADTLSSSKSAQYGVEPMPIDVISPGEDLPFEDKSYDFVISSHVIEHFYDPIKALIEWQRVARKYIFIICPHKDRMFDRDKDTTTYDELLFRRNVDYVKQEHCHQSFWDTEAFVEVCEALNFNIVEIQDTDDKVGNGFTVVIKLD